MTNRRPIDSSRWQLNKSRSTRSAQEIASYTLSLNLNPQLHSTLFIKPLYASFSSDRHFVWIIYFCQANKCSVLLSFLKYTPFETRLNSNVDTFVKMPLFLF